MGQPGCNTTKRCGVGADLNKKDHHKSKRKKYVPKKKQKRKVMEIWDH
jgi:hypothetical protein